MDEAKVPPIKQPDFDVKIRLTAKQELALKKFLERVTVGDCESEEEIVAVLRTWLQLEEQS